MGNGRVGRKAPNQPHGSGVRQCECLEAFLRHTANNFSMYALQAAVCGKLRVGAAAGRGRNGGQRTNPR